MNVASNDGTANRGDLLKARFYVGLKLSVLSAHPSSSLLAVEKEDLGKAAQENINLCPPVNLPFFPFFASNIDKLGGTL